MSVLDTLPSSSPSGCRVAYRCAASTSHPLVNTTASNHSNNSTSLLPLIHPNWLLCCLLGHLRLTSTSLPPPPPLPLVVSCLHLPPLVDMLSLINLRLCNRHPPVGCCVFLPPHCPPLAFVFSPTVMCHVVIGTANAMPWVNFQHSPLPS